eukprot:6471607-Amphidinium_carterae.1
MQGESRTKKNFERKERLEGNLAFQNVGNPDGNWVDVPILQRMCIDMLSLVFLIYDLIVTPYVIAWQVTTVEAA